MKRFVSFLYFLPSSLLLMAGDRLPNSSKPWSPTFSITVLIIGVLLIIWGNVTDKDEKEIRDNLQMFGSFGVLAGIMGLITTCISSVAS